MYKWLKNWLKYKDGDKPDPLDTTPVVPMPMRPAQIINMDDLLKDFDDEAHKRTSADTSD